jgi:hypothetical protein
MTDDLLDELRDADPVNRETLELPASLQARVTTSAARRHRSPRLALILISIAVGALGAVVVVALGPGGGGGRLSLADRAYAATAGPGVRHWKISIRTYIDGRRRGIVQRQEGWARGTTLHVLLFDERRLTSDIRQTPSTTRSWSAGANDYIETPTPKRRASGPLQLGDPFAYFRHAHDNDQLVRVNATTYRARTDKRSFPADATLTYVLDPKTALPAQAVLEYTRGSGVSPSPLDGSRYRVVYGYDNYDRLPDTAANRADLDLLEHPGAGPSKTDARTVFAILRDGAPLTAEQRRSASVFAKHTLPANPRFDVTSARRGPDDVVLMAGAGYVFMFRHSGGTSATVDTAVKRGMAISGGGGDATRGMYVVVPDDVTVVRARLPRRPWRTFPVKQNVAVLPSGGYHFRLVR